MATGSGRECLRSSGRLLDSGRYVHIHVAVFACVSYFYLPLNLTLNCPLIFYPFHAKRLRAWIAHNSSFVAFPAKLTVLRHQVTKHEVSRIILFYFNTSFECFASCNILIIWSSNRLAESSEHMFPKFNWMFPKVDWMFLKFTERFLKFTEIF